MKNREQKSPIPLNYLSPLWPYLLGLLVLCVLVYFNPDKVGFLIAWIIGSLLKVAYTIYKYYHS